METVNELQANHNSSATHFWVVIHQLRYADVDV